MTRALAGLLCLAFALGACADGRDARSHAARIAAAAGLNRMEIRAGTFDLVAYARFGAAPVLRVYIEGDGHAWASRDMPSEDPTPWTPVALELAAMDPAASVAYLARPCQYGVPGSALGCDAVYWTVGRYGEAVVAGMNTAVDRLLALSGARSLELVGFSGGGSVAALIAARRRDVASLRTVATNLDTKAWTERLGLSPLTESQNPAAFADRLQDIPQMHFGGAMDSVVDAAILQAFVARFAVRSCVNSELIAGVGHAEGWPAVWPVLLRRPVRCAVP